ncbi:hypothetical protein AB1N83_012336 [Pleurotus pulmonarius]
MIQISHSHATPTCALSEPSVPTTYRVYSQDLRTHTNPDCPVNVQRVLMAALRNVKPESTSKLRRPSETLRCDTCNELRAAYNWTLPSIWFRHPDCAPDPGDLPVSSELVLLYCSLSAFRRTYHELREEMDGMKAAVGDVGELKDRVERMERLLFELQQLAS